MKQPTRRPGRPAGTDYAEDLIALAMVADKLVASPGMKPMTATKAVFDSKRWRGRGGTERGTTVTRWQRKWPDQAGAMLADARLRAIRSNRPYRNDVTTPSTRMPAGVTWPHMVFTPSTDFLRTVKIATQGLRDFEKSYRPVMESLAKLTNNAKTIREANPLVPPYSPILAAIKVPQVPDSVIEQFRQINNSPTIIAMRELMKKRS